MKTVQQLKNASSYATVWAEKSDQRDDKNFTKSVIIIVMVRLSPAANFVDMI